MSAPAGTLTIRPATEEDIPLLRALAQRIWHACYPGVIPVEQIDHMLDWLFQTDRIVDELRRGVRWAIAETSGPVGFLSHERLRTGVVRLHKIYLVPELHGLGLGQAMLRQVVDGARAEAATAIELRVMRGNARALAAYARAGFRVIGASVNDVGAGFTTDGLELRLDLPSA